MVAAVFGVSEKIEDKDFLPVVVDGGDEAEIVPAHIEDSDDLSAPHFHLRRVSTRFCHLPESTSRAQSFSARSALGNREA
jgi:hypothetical protein